MHNNQEADAGVTVLSYEQSTAPNGLNAITNNPVWTLQTDLCVLQGGSRGPAVGTIPQDSRERALYYSSTPEEPTQSIDRFTGEVVTRQQVVGVGSHTSSKFPTTPRWGRYQVRPALKLSATEKIELVENKPFSALQANQARYTGSIMGNDGNAIQVVEFGEYPQEVVNEDLAHKLDAALKRGELKKTDKKYSFYSFEQKRKSPSISDRMNELFSENVSSRVSDPEKEYPTKDVQVLTKNYREYEFDGRRFIRFQESIHPRDEMHRDLLKLSDGQSIPKGKTFWVEVTPIEWLVEPENSPHAGYWVAKNALFTAPFDRSFKYDKAFEETDLYKHLNTCFIKEIKTTGRNIGQETFLHDRFSRHPDLQIKPDDFSGKPGTVIGGGVAAQSLGPVMANGGFVNTKL